MSFIIDVSENQQSLVRKKFSVRQAEKKERKKLSVSISEFSRKGEKK